MFICQLLQNEFGDTPLCTACEKGHLDVATVLVQNGADIDYESKVRLFYVHSQCGQSKGYGLDS